jgi:hypothetical protein
MSQLTKSLTTRIQELTTSIETQTAELAAYKEVLRIEVAKEAPIEPSPSESPAKTSPVSTNGALGIDLTGVDFTGNKTAFVIAGPLPRRSEMSSLRGRYHRAIISSTQR